MSARSILLASLACVPIAFAHGSRHRAAGPTLRYHPKASDTSRPVPIEVYVTAKATDFTFRISFDKLPWGEACGRRCADATFFLDTDDDRRTGLKLGPHMAETGADLAVTVKAGRVYRASSAESLLRVRVRQFSNGTKGVEDGSVIADLDPRHDADRVQTDGKHVFLRIDASEVTLPAGHRMRVIYHPPSHAAIVGHAKGMLSGRVRVRRRHHH